jgi:predicted nucleotidyltransferase
LGNKLKQASLRRYSRAAAQKQLNQFLDRCRTVNGMTPNMAEPLSLCEVMSVTVFGSYARGSMDVGDVDLVVKVQIRDVPEAHRYIEQVTKQIFSQAAAHHPIVIAEIYLFKNLNILATTDILPGNLGEDEVIRCDVG